ncbi:GNAT family N-acetyltransferase [Gordonia sp. ABSL11-1]|uniref:GNAT family N-acetyltransferase n=1 Tax=Gordonia sp. ABSL11-1 TaxID=3053924 RepID=UPI002572C181|nr:GNAT family N-acetyltransferase [Gordonia sp. ABSL11-1]MDL9948117.1 GNAT family N-acetyltransferase [Gordonia sp. ABSL11-1]
MSHPGTEHGEANQRRQSLRFVAVAQDDPRARPMLDDLALEYATRYGHPVELLREEIFTYPAAEFSAPGGALVLGDDGEHIVAGGAFRRFDVQTAELKRIWTSAAHRGRGYGRQVVYELERRIASLGYRRIHLTTGWQQPEAVALYVTAGYTAEFDPALYPTGRVPHAFSKQVPSPHSR